MPAPMPFRDFERLVKSHGCTLDRKGSHGTVMFHGQTVSRFAVTNGKNTKGDEIKPIYLKQFLQNMRRLS